MRKTGFGKVLGLGMLLSLMGFGLSGCDYWPPALQESDITLVAYPDIRMCCRSTIRQPCNIGSCMVVTRNRPSELTVAPRCEPFHSSFSGAAPEAFGNQSVAPL